VEKKWFYWRFNFNRETCELNKCRISSSIKIFLILYVRWKFIIFVYSDTHKLFFKFYELQDKLKWVLKLNLLVNYNELNNFLKVHIARQL